jgi:hypothetical protein
MMRMKPKASTRTPGCVVADKQLMDIAEPKTVRVPFPAGAYGKGEPNC